jgi:two-component system NtrC family sensor kinase
MISLYAEPGAAAETSVPAADSSSAGVCPLGAEAIGLASLVHHAHSVAAAETLELVQRAFHQHRVEYMAVVRDLRVIGLCARGQIGFIMSARFGFAIFSQNPVETAMVERPLIVKTSMPVRALLDQALARRGEDFQQDIALVDEGQHLVGLIKAETLAQLQSRIVSEQLEELRRQHAVLRRQNLALFEATHAARQTQGAYAGLFENHALGVALLDGDGNIAAHNRRLAELLNCPDDALPIASFVAWVRELDRPRLLALLDAHARGVTRAATHEFIIEVPDRGERSFRCSTGWIRETGQICACLDDVTEQRTLERSALQLEKQDLLDTLVGGVAHELNNKLTPVLGFSELLRAEAPGVVGEYVGHITKSVAEAARIIRQLLELSNPASQITPLLDLRTTVEETLVMLKFSIRECDCRVVPVLPAAPVYVAGDTSQLKQVVMNLIINALHAVEERISPAIEIEVRQSGERGEIIVTDNGCGIAPENLGRIFDPFFTTKGPKRGTGLGLSICFSIVRQHGGEIRVRSTRGNGAQFTVSLPLQDQETGRQAMAIRDEWRPPCIPLRTGLRVLIVEDEVVVQRLMQEVLSTTFGCRVDLANDGGQALALAEREDYALIVSDVKMPRVGGIEFYRRLQATRPGLARRIVFVTGQPGDRPLQAELGSVPVPVVAKPFRLEQLAAACRPFLQEPEPAARSA